MNIGLHHYRVFYDMTHDKKITLSLEKELIGERK